MANIGGTNANDLLVGTNGDDVIRGEGGDDSLTGGMGDDRLVGGMGNDRLDGELGNDKLFGGDGQDQLTDLSGGNDQLFGDAGNDSLYVSRYTTPVATTLLLDGGAGDDVISYYDAADLHRVTLRGGEGRDEMSVIALSRVTIDAGSGDDSLYVYVGGNSKTVTLGSGADRLTLDHGGGQAVRITDFNLAEDHIDLNRIAAQLSGWDQRTNPFATGHLRLIQVGGDALLQIDVDGGGNGWSDLALFQSTLVSGFTETQFGFHPDGRPVAGLSIAGTQDGDTLQGTNGDDVLRGLGGADILYGGIGDDRLVGGDGFDTLDGGLGSDKLFGGNFADRLIDQAGGNDQLFGEDGDDSLYVSRFSPSLANSLLLDGGSGNDSIIYNDIFSQHRVTIRGGEGNDDISVSGLSRVSIDAGSGDDHLLLSITGNAKTVTLGDGADIVAFTGSGGAAAQITDFSLAQDKVDLTPLLGQLLNWDQSSNPFSTGHLRLINQGTGAMLQVDIYGGGSAWQDVALFQGRQASGFTDQQMGYYPDGRPVPGLTIAGTAGNDMLQGTVGNDALRGLGGDDTLLGGAGDDRLVGGDGFDTLDGGLGSDKLFGGDGQDDLRDSLGGNDQLFGEDGNDRISAIRYSVPASTIVLDGGAGDDAISYSDASDQHRVTIRGGLGNDDIEVVAASRVAVDGGAGDDRVTLQLMGLEKTVTLGGGADSLTLAYYGSGSVRVTDFDVAQDRLDLTGLLAQLQNWDQESDPFTTGHLQFLQSGYDTLLQIDLNGGGDLWQTMALFQNLQASTLPQDLFGPVSTADVPLIG
ncbi:MAG: hypothetical protein DI533_21495 [Cereibacter sphaeroides]|uniref:Calcium-binding protein n=1 Tax=Cereibacter sphaeroides TaxID=1063 RepID=A0A2W5U9V9_CERSP|nr:MAG: hypothetical protein DI533_21495 [Cereibacter sphaeroides]